MAYGLKSPFSSWSGNGEKIHHNVVPDDKWSAGSPTWRSDQSYERTYTPPPSVNITYNGVVYVRKFDHWGYTYRGTWPGYESRITESGDEIIVDNAPENVDSETHLSGYLTITAYMRLEEQTSPPPQYFVVVVNADPAGGGQVTGGGTYEQGASCTISATPNSGYRFDKWISSYGGVVGTSSCSFIVTQSVTWTAIFKKTDEKTGELLCTGSDSSVGAGKMLCDSSGNLLYVG